MKKTVFLCLVLLAVGFIPEASAQDPKAKKLLDKMSRYYKSLKTYRADIEYQITSASDKSLSESVKGQITVKGGMYRLKAGEQEVYNDTKKTWTYLKDVNEVQLSDYEPEEGDINPAKVYEMYKKGFKYRFFETKKSAGAVYDVVDLEPKDKSKDYFKIRMNIEQKTGRLQSWQIFERSGNRYLYTVKKFTPNVKVDNAYFRFNTAKYPGVEVIEF